jgi:hypothetical protein
LPEIKKSAIGETLKTPVFPALSALTPRERADTYATLSAGGELRQSERPASEIR